MKRRLSFSILMIAKKNKITETLFNNNNSKIQYRIEEDSAV